MGGGSNHNTPMKAQPFNNTPIRQGGNPNSYGNLSGGNANQSQTNTQRSTEGGSQPDRQPRMSQNDYGGNNPNGGMQNNMGMQRNNMNQNNRQVRPQSIDPNRVSNIQAHNFGGMGNQNQPRPNDDNFFGNLGMKNGPASSSKIDDDGIDWGM